MFKRSSDGATGAAELVQIETAVNETVFWMEDGA